MLRKCLLTDRMHEVAVPSVVNKHLYGRVYSQQSIYPKITQLKLFSLAPY